MIKRIISIFLAFGLTATFAASQGSGGSGGGSGSGGQNSTNSQSSSSGGGKGGGDNGSNQGGGGGGGNGGPSGSFSIEAEMIAYKSLESDSEAIGCDIFLALGYAPTSATSKCPFAAVKATNVKILVGSPTQFSSFQQWQAAMTISQLLLIRVNALDKNCSTATVSASGRGGVAPTDVLNDAQQGLSILQTALGLFATNEAPTGVTGTIQDQALVYAVARQLRIGGVYVIAPDFYPPKILEMGDASPFLNRVTQLLTARACLQASADTNAKTIADDNQAITTGKIGNTPVTDDEKSAMQTNLPNLTANQTKMTATISAIDQFINSLSTSPSTGGGGQNPGNNSQSSKNTTSTNPAPGSTTVNVNSATPPSVLPNSGIPLIANLMAADQLAQALQFRGGWVDNDTYTPGDMVTYARQSYEATASISNSKTAPPEDKTHWQQSSWYVLSLKALESGGGVMNRSKLMSGTRVYFSGGAVSTYALFRIDGDFVCSANVYDYDGYLRDEDFPGKFRANDIDPSKQLVLVRSPGCKN